MSALKKRPAMADVQEQQIKGLYQCIDVLDLTLENLSQAVDELQSLQAKQQPASSGPFALLESLIDTCLQGLEWAAHKLVCRFFP